MTNVLVFLISCFFLIRTGVAFVPSKNAFLLPSCRINSNALRAQQPSSSFDANVSEIQAIVGLTDAELKRILARVPEMSDYESSATEACATKLKERLSLSTIEFKKKIVLRLPQCLGYGFEDDINPSLKLLEEFLDMSNDELRSLVLKCPQIIGLDFSTEVKPNIEAIMDAIGDDSIAAAKNEILKKPASLKLAVRGGVSPSKTTKT